MQSDKFMFNLSKLIAHDNILNECMKKKLSGTISICHIESVRSNIYLKAFKLNFKLDIQLFQLIQFALIYSNVQL